VTGLGQFGMCVAHIEGARPISRTFAGAYTEDDRQAVKGRARPHANLDAAPLHR
jgi:hypothetical protein